MIFTPVGELAALVRAREISPVELAEHCLERLERLGPKYNCVVTVMRQHGLEWLFRLLRQPWRLRRQLALPAFVWLVLNERMGRDRPR